MIFFPIWNNFITIFFFLLIILLPYNIFGINSYFKNGLRFKRSINYQITYVGPGSSCLMEGVKCTNKSVCISGICVCLLNQISVGGACLTKSFESGLYFF